MNVRTAGTPVRARRKIARRILPFVSLLYIVAYLDRANVAFANVPMRADLGFNEAVFGFGAGIFFIGYFLLEIPGALIVERWSARRWLARIIVSWGICTVLIGFVRTEQQFYAARFLLGAAEAGFFPGVLVYLTHWFREEDRAKAIAGFVTAAPVSLLIGAPLSALILQIDAFGMPGWRWLFVLQGIPAVVLGIVTLFYLTDHPRQASWLDPAEREWISGELERERNAKRGTGSRRWWRAALSRNVLFLTGAHFFANMAGYGFILWLPHTLQIGAGFGPAASSVIAGLPFAAAIAAMVLNGRSSDRRRERKGHACSAFLAAAVLMGFAAVPAQPPWLTVAVLTLTGGAVFAWIPPFWSLPTATLGESSAAAAVGLINSVGNLGGFAGPFLVGSLLAAGWTPGGASSVLAIAYATAALLTWSVRLSSVDAERVPTSTP
jgi:ACS family tartrate transporter-like MFS transporter